MMVSHFDYLWPDLEQCRNKLWSKDQKGYTGYICVVKHIFNNEVTMRYKS